MFIAVTFSTDSSIALSLEKGNFDEVKKTVESYTKICNVLLITGDFTNYSNLFSKVIHVACGFKVYRPLNWLLYYVKAFLTLLSYRREILLIRAYGIGCLHAALFSRLFKIPLISSYEYDWSSQMFFTGRIVLGYIARFIERFVLRSSTITIGASKGLCEKAKRKGAGKVVYIPNGVDFNDVDSSLNEETKKPDLTGRKLILYVGRLHKIKRVEDLIVAFSILIKKGWNAFLLIVGDGKEKEKLIKLTEELGLKGKVIFAGSIEHKSVYKLMRLSNVLVLPSVAEGNPRALLEAMACKVPVVATNVPGIKDLIVNGEDGLLVEPFNPVNLSEAIERVIADDELSKKISEKAYEKVRKEFDLKNILKLNLDLTLMVIRSR
jgi:glycosyltransferase involved in cell wall biosynthesis